jgi:hypothetical protein
MVEDDTGTTLALNLNSNLKMDYHAVLYRPVFTTKRDVSEQICFTLAWDYCTQSAKFGDRYWPILLQQEESRF